MTIKVRHFKRKKGLGVKHAFLGLTTLVCLFFLGLIFMPMPSYKECFRTLADMQRHAKKTNENTPMENSDTLRPEFINYYKSLAPSFLDSLKIKAKWLLSKISLAKPAAWDITAFKQIIEDLGQIRQQSGMKDNFVYRIQTQPNSKITVFGNIQGSYHSLVRGLAKLKELGIIDETLKISNPQNYIIFMGDVVDRSAFTLETLTAVMRLIQANPNNVIYLRGNHESNNYWQEHTLKIELQMRAKELSTSAIPLEMEVNRFFNSLPIAVYLAIPNETSDFVRISDAGRESSTLLNESNFADTLIKPTAPGATYFAIKENPNPSTTKVNIKAIIRGEKKRKTFQKNEGLRYLPPDLDSVAWTILSCPNVVYQKALDFYNDAFAIISVAEKFSDWEITLFTRDLRTKESFKELRYNFISGLDLEAHKKMTTTQAQPQAQAATQQVTQASPQSVQQPQQQTQTVPTQQAIPQVAQQPSPVTPQPTQNIQQQPISTAVAAQQTQTMPLSQTPAPQAAQTTQPVAAANPPAQQPQLLQIITDKEDQKEEQKPNNLPVNQTINQNQPTINQTQ